MTYNQALRFEKYFKNKEYDTRIKNRTKPAKKYDFNGKSLGVFNPDDIVRILPSEERYRNRIKVIHENEIVYVNPYYVHGTGKAFGASEELYIRVPDLVRGGETETIKFRNLEASYSVFRSKGQLIDSIIAGLTINPRIHPEILKGFHALISNPDKNYVWSADVEQKHINEVGRKLSELLTGVAAFDGLLEGFKKPKKFCVPLQENTPLIDALIDGKGISSKYGSGAASSFLSNVFEPMRATPKPKCALRDLEDHYLSHQKHMVYNYGLKRLLGLNHDPGFIYDCALKGIVSPLLDETVAKIREVCPDNDILDNLPATITSFFCRAIAQSINNCEVSKQLIMTYFQKNPIYQVNLDDLAWSNGIIKMRVNPLNNLRFYLRRGKFHLTSTRGERGILTYELHRIP